MSQIQLYQGAPVIVADDGAVQQIPVELLTEFAPIVAAYQQGQIQPQVWQQACEFVVKRSQELELAGAIAQQAIASHQAVNVELAATIREMAQNQQGVVIYECPNLAAVVYTFGVAFLLIMGSLVAHTVATSPKNPAPVPVQQQYL